MTLRTDASNGAFAGPTERPRRTAIKAKATAAGIAASMTAADEAPSSVCSEARDFALPHAGRRLFAFDPNVNPER